MLVRLLNQPGELDKVALKPFLPFHSDCYALFRQLFFYRWRAAGQGDRWIYGELDKVALKPFHPLLSILTPPSAPFNVH